MRTAAKVVIVSVLLAGVGLALFGSDELRQNVRDVLAVEQPAQEGTESKGSGEAAHQKADVPAASASLDATPDSLPQAPTNNATQRYTRQDTPLPEDIRQQLADANPPDSGESMPAKAPRGNAPTTNATATPSTESTQDAVIVGTMRRGDTVAELLGNWARSSDIQHYVNATNAVFPLRAFRAGQPYVIICDVESGTVKRFEYEVDNRRKLVVEPDANARAVARLERIHYDVRLALVEGRVEGSLFKAVADLGESPQLALLVAKLFGWEINFIRDIQDGDSFSMLVEKLYRGGDFSGYGRTLGASFTNKGKKYEAFLFHDGQGREQYYNSKGENLKKTLLQAPLSFTRVTSGYTHSRRHPIFGDYRPHLGVDYGAPTGTPVKAVGDGSVTLRGWVGGYGNQVVIRHSGGLESLYAHLSGFARGLQKGSYVRQGQVIGYVGSTGNSTGPHLDFRLRQNGTFINPTKAINPRSEPVSAGLSGAFAARKDIVRAYMQGERDLSDYKPESLRAHDVARALSGEGEARKGKAEARAQRHQKPRDARENRSERGGKKRDVKGRGGKGGKSGKDGSRNAPKGKRGKRN